MAATVEHPDDEVSVKVEPEFVADVEGVDVLTQIEAVREDPVGLIISLTVELDLALELPLNPGTFRWNKPITATTTPTIMMKPKREKRRHLETGRDFGF